MVVVLVESFLFPAINVTSIHAVGWVFPLCREIWFQMRWSNFGKIFLLLLFAFQTSLLEPAHSSECTGWTNRRIALMKYHTARALESLRWSYLGDNESSRMDSCFYKRSNYEDKRMGKLAASFLEHFPHAFSVDPYPQHSRVHQCSLFLWTSYVVAFYLSIGGWIM